MERYELYEANNKTKSKKINLELTDIKFQNVVESSRTRYTISATIDKIKKVLASVKSDTVEENLDSREYYCQV
jgi:hypothetical protein